MCKSCDGGYYQAQCGREIACDHYDDYLLLYEEYDLEESVELDRAAYRDAFASYLRQWEE